MPTVATLDELVALVERTPSLYVRWSRGPADDADNRSHDELTGAPLPGLCANPLAVEAWWGDRPMRLWVARRLFDYLHLADQLTVRAQASSTPSEQTSSTASTSSSAAATCSSVAPV